MMVYLFNFITLCLQRQVAAKNDRKNRASFTFGRFLPDISKKTAEANAPPPQIIPLDRDPIRER